MVCRQYRPGADLRASHEHDSGYRRRGLYRLVRDALSADRGCSVLVLDDLSNGYADAVPAGLLVQGQIGDAGMLDQIFAAHSIDAVMNFASFIEVGESVSDPANYYRNNVGQTTVLLEAMARRKWLIEQMLPDYDRAHGLRSVCLRYFNAAGADPEGRFGERHDPETHLIPQVLQAASGRRESISIFGTDYDTSDGTRVRDYIHILDLGQAHRLALEHLRKGGESGAFNLGTKTLQHSGSNRCVKPRPLQWVSDPGAGHSSAQLCQ